VLINPAVMRSYDVEPIVEFTMKDLLNNLASLIAIRTIYDNTAT
jgi:hypothetical protein